MPATPGDALEPARDVGHVRGALAAQVDDDRDGPLRPRVRVALEDRVDARVLEPDAQQQARRARRRCAARRGPPRGLSVVPRVTSPPSRGGPRRPRPRRRTRTAPTRRCTGVCEHEPASEVDLERDRPAAEGVERGDATDDSATAAAGGSRRSGGRRADRRPDPCAPSACADRRHPGHDPPPRLHGTVRPGELVGGERRALAADPQRDPAGARRPRTRGTSPPRSRSTGRAPTWRNALRRASGEPGGQRPPAAPLPPERRDAQPPPTPDRQRRERARAATADPAANDWSAHAS